MATTPMIINAQEACRTRFCAAEACELEAEPASRLCWRCQKRDDVKLHTVPATAGNNLQCSRCRKWKPDAEYHMHRASQGGARRGRRSECQDCCNQRRRDARTGPNGALIRATEAARRREYTAAKRAELNAIREAHHAAAS